MEQILGLDVCKDMLIGDEMRRGISGGQKKRVTIGMFRFTVGFLQCVSCPSRLFTYVQGHKYIA